MRTSDSVADVATPPNRAEPSQIRARLLSAGERWGALIAGVMLAGGGGVAVFLTSNQAGSTALVLVGALFVLLGIQGTQVTRASKDSVELASRPEEIAAKAKEIAEDGEPKDARAFLDGAVSADPKLRSAPAIREISAELYEMQVRHALELVTWDKGLRVYRVDDDGIIDFSIRGRLKELRSVAIDVVVKFSKSDAPITLSRVKEHVLAGRFAALLFVSNTELSTGFSSRLATLREAGDKIDSVQWLSVDDNDALSACIDRLADGLEGSSDPSP